MMRRGALGLVIVAGLLALAGGPVLAQTPTLAERAALAQQAAFRDRVGMAAMQTAVAVAQEADSVPQHATRLKLAAWTIQEPEAVARRLAVMAASVATVDSTTTDAALQTLITNNWTLIASIFTGARQ